MGNLAILCAAFDLEHLVSEMKVKSTPVLYRYSRSIGTVSVPPLSRQFQDSRLIKISTAISGLPPLLVLWGCLFHVAEVGEFAAMRFRFGDGVESCVEKRGCQV